MSDLSKLTLKAAVDGLKAKEFSSAEITQAFLTNIEASNPTLNAYVEVTADKALEMAKASDARLAAGDGGALLKVIVETALLDDDAIVLACEAAVEAGADFVKTSTGFSTAGATAEHVALMRRTVGEGIGVKASGGVRTRADALAMIEAGATRIGASSALAILGSD